MYQRSMSHLPGIRSTVAADSALWFASVPWQLSDVNVSVGQGSLGPDCDFIPPTTPPQLSHVYSLDDSVFECSR